MNDTVIAKIIPLYCSSGTIVSRYNNYDYRLISSRLPGVLSCSGACGVEFIMLPAFYDNLGAVTDSLVQSGLAFPVIHADKDIGELFSRGNKTDGIGGSDDTVETTRAYELFALNCAAGADIGAEKIVLHLWGGIMSDTNFDCLIARYTRLYDIAASHRLALLIENIPCAVRDPLSNLRDIANAYPECGIGSARDDKNDAAGTVNSGLHSAGTPSVGFVYDTRFGEFHRQMRDFFASDWFRSGKIAHVHISDLRAGADRDFSRLRPILHPGEGCADFTEFFNLLSASGYKGTVTLESPVCEQCFPGNLDLVKLTKTLTYIRNELDNISQ